MKRFTEKHFPMLMVNKSGEFTIARNEKIYLLNVEYGYKIATKAEKELLYTKGYKR